MTEASASSVVCAWRCAVTVAIASGGRYDRLVARFREAGAEAEAAGTGFGFSIAALQELLASEAPAGGESGVWLVACGDAAGLPAALERMAALHAQGEAAELCGEACSSESMRRGRADGWKKAAPAAHHRWTFGHPRPNGAWAPMPSI